MPGKAVDCGCSRSIFSRRTISDPGPPTLPKRRSDRVLEFAIILTVLGALLIFAAGIFASVPKTFVSGGSTPTAPPVAYRECRYCRYLYIGRVNPERTMFVFDSHPFIGLPLTRTTRFVTCEKSYFDHIVAMTEVMRRVGAGSIETIAP
jgi:hypothetical protein